ncbi:MAG TPA: ShlB/FhaC/HecB family hemolysin secretion/activation protein [Burkholderiaceae bacterium]|nr:ShlB/FhaC/HecB family hemolysin secretion/activation protein [Burkholderiaceae bacterium]
MNLRPLSLAGRTRTQSARIAFRRRRCAMLLAFLACPPAHSQTTPQAPPAQVEVTRFEVVGNTLLPASKVDAVLAPFKGPQSADDLKRAALALQEHYARAGYGGVVAYLSPQAVSGGVVRIDVLEGRLSRVVVNGNRHFSEANIRRSLPSLVPGSTPRVDLADAQIRLANENPAKQIQVLLQPGSGTGEVEARVRVTEEPVQRFSFGIDNRGNDRTGNLRASLGWQHADIGGRDHVLSAQAQASPDEPSAVKVLSLAYRVPLYAARTAIDAYAAYSNVKPGATPTLAGDLQFNGRGRLFGVRATRYLQRLAGFDQRLSVGLDQRAYDNQCSIVGLPAGACGPAGESVSVQPVSIDYMLQRGVGLPLSLDLGLAHNLQIGGGHASDSRFQAVRPGATPRFSVLHASASAGVALVNGLQANVRFSGQFASGGLVPGEQFGIGGMTSVRGYEERELAGDHGAFTSVELTSPDLGKRAGFGQGHLHLLAFADGGWIRNRLGTPCLDNHVECTISSLGVGARLSLDRWQAQAYLANPTKSSLLTRRAHTKVHLALGVSF